MIIIRQFTKEFNNRFFFNIVFMNKRKHSIRICEKNFKIEIRKEIKSEIENNDLIKTNLCSKKDKMNIKKYYNILFFFTFFHNEFSRIKCSWLLTDIVLFDLRKLAIIDFFIYILLMVNELTFLISKIKTIKYLLRY